MQRNRIRILFLGDIVSSIGRRVVKYYLKNYKKSKEIDFVIANGENATHGKGLSLSHYQEWIVLPQAITSLKIETAFLTLWIIIYVR